MLSSSPPPPEADAPPERIVPINARPPRPSLVASPARAPVRGPIRLPARRRLGVYAVSVSTWITGSVWLVFHNFVHVRGEFGPTPSPVEPWWLKLHGAAAFATLWIFGLLWGVHVLNGWTARRRRWSGGALFGVAVFLIGSGYLLYYAGDEGLRGLVSAAHWVVGLAAPMAFIWHRYLSRDRG